MKEKIHVTRQEILEAMKAGRVRELAKKTFTELGQDCPRGDCVDNLVKSLETIGRRILAQEKRLAPAEDAPA